MKATEEEEGNFISALGLRVQFIAVAGDLDGCSPSGCREVKAGASLILCFSV